MHKIKCLTIAKGSANRLMLFQFFASITMAVTAMFFEGKHVAYSILLGGLITLPGTLIFSKEFFVFIRPAEAKSFMKRIYAAQIKKIGIHVLLLIVVIKFLHVDFRPFFMGFVAIQLTYWLTPWLFKES